MQLQHFKRCINFKYNKKLLPNGTSERKNTFKTANFKSEVGFEDIERTINVM